MWLLAILLIIYINKVVGNNLTVYNQDKLFYGINGVPIILSSNLYYGVEKFAPKLYFHPDEIFFPYVSVVVEKSDVDTTIHYRYIFYYLQNSSPLLRVLDQDNSTNMVIFTLDDIKTQLFDFKYIDVYAVDGKNIKVTYTNKNKAIPYSNIRQDGTIYFSVALFTHNFHVVGNGIVSLASIGLPLRAICEEVVFNAIIDKSQFDNEKLIPEFWMLLRAAYLSTDIGSETFQAYATKVGLFSCPNLRVDFVDIIYDLSGKYIDLGSLYYPETVSSKNLLDFLDEHKLLDIIVDSFGDII